MNPKKLLLLIFVLAFFDQHNAQTCKEVVGYYPNWQWGDRAKLVNPTTINYSKYSIINYCFFEPKADGSIVTTDSWADENLLEGPKIWFPVVVNDFSKSIVGLAHAANVKVLISIGGWKLSTQFPQIAADPAKRAIFAGACRQLITKYKVDGIDIDWEYPGYTDHGGTSADKQNFTLFLKQVRDSLDAYGTKTGKKYLFSIAVGASPAHASHVEWSNIIPMVDMINLMSYDFFGAWDATSNHNSPLYAPAQGDPTFNANAAFTMLTQTYNVPANKINIGVAFYGRSVTKCTSLFGTHSGTENTVLFADDQGTPLYYNILKNISQFTKNWDNTAKVPYLLNGPDQTFVSYDDPTSIAEKAKYINSKGARGAIIWEITGDYVETTPGSGIIKGTPLADTLNYIFCNHINVGIEEKKGSLASGLVFPNPTNGEINLQRIDASNNSATLLIYNNLGELVYYNELILNKGLNNSALKINLANGVYTLRLQTAEKTFTDKMIVEH